jgi:hypothetical protein
MPMIVISYHRSDSSANAGSETVRAGREANAGNQRNNASKSLFIEAQGMPSSAFTLHLHNAILCIITNGRVLLTAVPFHCRMDDHASLARWGSSWSLTSRS